MLDIKWDRAADLQRGVSNMRGARHLTASEGGVLGVPDVPELVPAHRAAGHRPGRRADVGGGPPRAVANSLPYLLSLATTANTRSALT